MVYYLLCFIYKERDLKYGNDMSKSKKGLVLSILIILHTSCVFNSDKKVFEHSYEKYWDKYSDEQLIDSLYSDTLIVGCGVEEGDVSKEFYINVTKELLVDLSEDKRNIDSLYPMTAFDCISISQLPLGLKRTFTEKQMKKFMEIINDPISFDWGETTYEAEFQVDFIRQGKKSASLTIGADTSVIETMGWPSFKKMKFGHLKPQACNNLKILLNDIYH